MSTISELSETYHVAPRVAHRVVSGRVAIVETRENKLITLNEVGSEVWQRLDGRSVGDITQELIPLFDIAPEELARDVRVFLKKLESSGLVVIGSPDRTG